MENKVKEFSAQCHSSLKKAGARITQPRTAVIDVLAASRKPLSAKDIYQKLQKRKATATVDQVSVYRTLETLLDLELIHQVFPDGGYMACFHQRCGDDLHVIARCQSCDRIVELDVPQETTAPMLWYLENKEGFTPEGHAFQINGLCRDCR